MLLFEKTSTRTRCAFETAAYDEGANVTFLSNSQMGKKESLEDTAKVLGRFYDGIEFRGFKQETVELLAKYSGVPVWNGLTDLYHRGVTSVMVEGGTRVLQQMIDAHTWDEARIEVSPRRVGQGTAAPVIEGQIQKLYVIDGNQITCLVASPT